jgi:nitrogen fixation protein NifQ
MPSVGHDPSQTSAHLSSRHALGHRLAQENSSASGPLKTPEISVYRGLLALASRPAYGVTLALAGTVAHSWHARGMRYLPIFGLDAETSYRLLSSHFPGIGRMMGVAWGELTSPPVFEEAYLLGDLVDMLDQHRTVVDEDSTWLAHAVATSCVGHDELWRAMNLSSANVLRDLLLDFFTVFAARNRSDMSWKRFFIQVLVERAERRMQRAPSSGPVPDYARCIGIERA